MYFVYSLILTVGFLILLPRFVWDAITKGKYAAGFWQRFGFLPEFQRGEKIIWLHCVSVGETNAARPLIDRILREFDGYQIVVSTTTKTGQALAQDLFRDKAALVFYFPFDWRFAVRRSLRHIRPDAILIVETELWFNFLREAKRRQCKIALVNGRLSEKSFRRYHIIRNLMREVLANLDLALMSGEADAARIVELGVDAAKVFVTGNVKFDLPVDQAESDLTAHFRARFGVDDSRALIVAASTHEPEEKWLVTAYQDLLEKSRANSPRLLIAPRHPERFARIADLLEKSGLNWVRRFDETDTSDKLADVILLDSIGELRAVYKLATIVFVGGSLIKHGGQNVLEPIAARKCVVTGFHTANFAQIVKQLRAENAIVQLPELGENEVAERLANVFQELLHDATKRQQLAENAFAVLQTNQGATARTIEKLLTMIG